MKKKIEIFGFLVLILLIIFRVINPFEEDQKIFFASAYITDNSLYDFPKNVYFTFELKPIFSRIFYYAIFKIVQPLEIWENKLLFIQIVQSLFILIIVFGAFLFSRDKSSNKVFQNKLFFGTVFFLVSVGSESFMQVEHVALVLSLYAVWMFHKNNLFFDIFAGIILGFIAGLKGITVLYSLSLIVYCFFYVKRNIFLLSTVFILIFSYSLYLSFRDIEIARLLQGNNFDIFRSINNLVRTWKYILIDQVYLFSIFGYIVMYFYVLFKKFHNKELIMKFYLPSFIIFSLLLPSIIFQVGFSYHYFGILLFLLIMLRASLDLYSCNFGFSVVKFIDIKFILPSVLIYLIFSTSVFSHSKNLMEKNISNFNSEILVSDSIKKLVPNDKSVLFLTDGVINFYVNNYSACYEFYPITINRLLPKYPNIPSKLKIRYKDILSCIQNFDGNYILIQTNWFPKRFYNSIYPNKKYISVANLNTIERNYILYKKIQ